MNTHRLLLIIQREYLQMVARKSFIIMTLLLPILSIAVCGVLPALLSTVKSNEQKNVAVIDRTPGQIFATQLAQSSDDYRFLVVDNVDDASVRAYYDQPNAEGPIHAVVIIPDSVVSAPVVYIYSDQSVAPSLETDLQHALRPVLRSERVASFAIDSLEQIIRYCDVHLDVRNIKWDADGGETLSSSKLSGIIGMVLALLTYMFVMMYGAMIMNGVIEEKTNRIVEVIVSSCKPVELLLGKIIGVALVGFTQLAIWGILLGACGFVLTSLWGIDMATGGMTAVEANAAVPALPDDQVGEIMQMLLSVNYPLIAVCFLLYFIGGYLLYASLFAAFGSAVDQASDASQFMMPIMIIMVFALYAGMFSIENPDGPLAWWCSVIPFTSPIVMMIRLPFDVPVWEFMLSFFLLYATAFLILWLSARIYRTGILMYGKKTTIGEILRWAKS